MDERRKSAVVMRQQGKYLREIAAALGISVATASLYCSGVQPKGKHPVTERKRAIGKLLEQLYQDGMPIPEIAELTGIPASTLFDWRREFGIEQNSRSRYMTAEMRKHLSEVLSQDKDGRMREEARLLYQNEHLSTPEIAAKMGVSAVTVGAWLKSLGIALRKTPTLRTREKLRDANLGSKRYNWKGGITPDRVRLRQSLLMRLAREACFKRDGYCCRSCGSKGGRLNAHHVWPFQRFPEQRFAVGNLITLCKVCHDHFHKAAGGHVRVAIGPFFVNRIEAPQGA